MSNGYEPKWDKAQAEAMVLKYTGKVLKRPLGTVRYTLLGAEELQHCGWGIRLRCWPKGNSYIICSNAIEEEHWVVV